MLFLQHNVATSHMYYILNIEISENIHKNNNNTYCIKK